MERFFLQLIKKTFTSLNKSPSELAKTLNFPLFRPLLSSEMWEKIPTH